MFYCSYQHVTNGYSFQYFLSSRKLPVTPGWTRDRVLINSASRLSIIEIDEEAGGGRAKEHCNDCNKNSR
eukprot:scaffold58147_cov60-Attheya_sp.AAC.6